MNLKPCVRLVFESTDRDHFLKREVIYSIKNRIHGEIYVVRNLRGAREFTSLDEAIRAVTLKNRRSGYNLSMTFTK